MAAAANGFVIGRYARNDEVGNQNRPRPKPRPILELFWGL